MHKYQTEGVEAKATVFKARDTENHAGRNKTGHAVWWLEIGYDYDVAGTKFTRPTEMMALESIRYFRLQETTLIPPSLPRNSLRSR